MARRYPKKRGRGTARRAARQLRGKVDPAETREARDPTNEVVDPRPDHVNDHWDDQLVEDRRRTPSVSPGSAADSPEPTFTDDSAHHPGRVVGSASGCCWIAFDDQTVLQTNLALPGNTGSSGNTIPAGNTVLCALPSRLAAQQRERVAVGDRAMVSRAEDGAWWVTSILPRSTELARPDPHNPRLRRVLAANVDLVVHVASVRKPPLVPALLDRFLIAIAESGAEPLVVINKCDLLDPPPPFGLVRGSLAGEEAEIAGIEPHRRLGIPIVLCAAKSGAGVDALREQLTGRTAVLAGHSGVGKSSLINALGGKDLAATGHVAGRGKGRHTTTRAALIELGHGIVLIDTPGIRELGLWRLDASDLDRHFPELAEHAVGCRFRNCSHSHEPECAVQAAAARGDLEQARIDTYHRIRASLATDPLRPTT